MFRAPPSQPSGRSLSHGRLEPPIVQAWLATLRLSHGLVWRNSVDVNLNSNPPLNFAKAVFSPNSQITNVAITETIKIFTPTPSTKQCGRVIICS